MSGEEGAPGGTKLAQLGWKGSSFSWGIGALGWVLWLEAENFQIQPPTAPEWP